MTSHALVREAARYGVRLFRSGDLIEYQAATRPPEALLSRLRAHKTELLEILPEPSGVPSAWVISSSGDGDMRLVVGSAPPWPNAVFEAASLVEILDARHRADRADAQDVADRLEIVLQGLRAIGVNAWLAS